MGHGLHWVGSPDDKGEAGNGGEEATELLTLLNGRGTTIDKEMPDNDKIGNAGNGIPSPLLRSTLATECGKETSQNHDQVGSNGHDGAATVEAGKQTQIEKEQGGGQAPVDITSPVDLAVNVLVSVGHMLVALTLDNMMIGDTHAGGHAKVGDGSSDGNHGGDEVVETLGLVSRG